MSDLALSSRPATEYAPGKAMPAEALVLRLQASLLSQRDLAAAATAFCTGVAEAFKCERVAVGLVERDKIELIASSSAREIGAHSDAARALLLAMHECRDQKTPLVWPAPASAFPHVTLAHQRLASGTVAAACSMPLMHDGTIAGVLTLERATAFADWELASTEDAASFAGPLLVLKRDAERSWAARLGITLRAGTRALLAPGRPGPRLALAGFVLALCAATLLPVPYRVGAPARLEAAVQRVLVAPADGFLRQANVRAGDTVKSGQVLAEMANEDMQLEKSRREAELRQHEDAYKAALARSDRAQMVVHQAKAGEAQAMLALAQGQIERAQIQAPFDGVVIKGDLSQNLGAPVQRGEALLTVAPGDGFRVIVEVEEADIAAVREGQRGRLLLAAQPDRQIEFTVRRIIPVSTTADGRNYFEVEAQAGAGGQALRPGLRGVAKIDAGTRSVLWAVAHRPLNWLRYHLWSLGLPA